MIFGTREIILYCRQVALWIGVDGIVLEIRTEWIQRFLVQEK